MKRALIVAVAVMSLLIVGCAEEPGLDGDVTGGRGGMTDPAVADDTEQSGEPDSPEESDPDVQEHEPEPTVEPVAEPDFPPAGMVRLNWEHSGINRVFEYDATECYAGQDYVSVEGAGVEVDGSSPADGKVTSTVHIFTSPSELLHEPTGTYHAGGVIRFTVEGTEIVADGRPHAAAPGVTLPSMFDYRIAGSTVDYRALWWVGDGEAGAGAVQVSCHHD